MTSLREAAVSVVARLRSAGHAAYLVGGCVRDRLLGRPEKDYDVATSARPEVVAGLFAETFFVGARFGVSLVRFEGHSIEVVTFRRDGEYRNHRHPEDVDFGTIEDDAARRDFTINALYEDPISGDIVDFHGGLADLRAGVVRAVGRPEQRFHEDALRLLRAIRFAARLGFRIEEETWSAIKDLAHSIEFISPERHRAELNLMLLDPSAASALRMMDECGLLQWLLPEIRAMHGVEQGSLWHPEGDVFVHTMLVLQHVEPRTIETVWGALLHDVGKPPTFEKDLETGRISFIGHHRVGAEMAREILGRLRFSNEEIKHISATVERHMTFMETPRMKPSTLRRFLSAPTIQTDLAVHRADCLGSRGMLDYWHLCRAELEKQASASQEVVPPPLLNGRDILALGVEPGPIIRRILEQIQDAQMDGRITTREEALDFAKGLLP